MELILEHPVICIVIGVYCLAATVAACWFGGKVLYGDDRAVKAMQREALAFSNELKAWGFDLIPPILNDFALLDFITLTRDFRHAADVMKNPVTARAALVKLLGNMVKHEMEDVTTRQAFFDAVYNLAKLANLKPSNP